VYSFGVLINELVSEQLPYTGVFPSNTAIKLQDLKSKVLAGERPLSVKSTPSILNKFIASCWDGKPAKRPEFREMATVKLKLSSISSPWQEAADTILNSTKTSSLKLLEMYKEREEVKFVKFIKNFINTYELERVLDANKWGDPNMRALMALLGVKNPGQDKVHRHMVDHFLQWFGNSPQILSIVYTLCTKPWFWGPCTDNQIETALSRPVNNILGTYMVIWDDLTGWVLCEVGKDKSKKQKIFKGSINSAGVSMYAADQLIKKMDELVKSNKKLISPAVGRPIMYSSVEIKTKWTTGGKDGMYSQSVKDNIIDEGADLSNYGTVTHFNFLY